MTHDDNGSGRRPFDETGDDPRAGNGPDGDGRALRGLPRAGASEELAPVIPLFGARGRSAAAHPSAGRDRGPAPADGIGATDRAEGQRPRLRPLRTTDLDVGEDAVAARGGGEAGPDRVGADDAETRAEARERAQGVLLRKLRSRSLSLSEARGVVRGIDDVDDAICDEIIDHFVDLGYLNDTVFAEQLAMSAIEKKGEGRRAVAETLRKRGIPRDIAEAALAALPDDDAERALEFARSKVRGVDGAEFDAALRRLAGQLGRRGYPSSVALTAARTALQEAGIGRSRSFARPAPGVRFTPDE